MSIIPDFLARLFSRQSQVLAWQWVPDDHVLDARNQPVAATPPFAAGDDYVVLRLAEMYLKSARILWKEFYPVVHAFVAYGDPAAQRSIATVAGPGQLKDLGNANLDRLIGLSYRLAGPVVYDGQDIELLAGLYAVPAADGARVLIDTLAQLGGLIPILKQATDVANIVKAGTEGLLGLDNTELTLGVRDTLRAPGIGQGRQARSGFLVAVNTPQAQFPAANLWVREGRLLEGPNPIAARPFDSHDMMLFELHRGPSRAANWATLPALAERARSFDFVLRNTPAEQLPPAINTAFRGFEADLRGVDDLTASDKAAIRSLVAEDLKSRVKAIQGGDLIETRSVAGTVVRLDPHGFRPRDIADPPAGAALPRRADNEALF